MDTDSRIRLAQPADASAVRDIYAPFCESTAVTFEEESPTDVEMAERIESTLETYPWLVCEVDGEVAGYAYAGRLRKRRAYQWTVELSVYVAADARGSGIGRGLYESLFAILKRQGVRDAYAVTTVPNPETERFHERMGFERCVDFPAMGYTDGEWHDIAWWRRSFGAKTADPDPITPLPELRDDPDWDVVVQAGVDYLE